ncbi:putative ribonuclease h protein [Quercus suber]|uniref:Ribonuclease h protein n=1 Tax=Quercus suber TaxID=58331 RepID=A0AAW0LI14_QUESU
MEWKTELIRSCFTVEDADAILSIPLSLHRPKDRRIWAETPNGKFSVKSAYRLAYEENRGGGKVGCSDPSARKKAWKGLWGLNLPQKVKHFAWKAARNILDSNEALRQRHIEVDSGCALCRNPTENILHILWFCAHAKNVWNSSKFYLPFDIGPTWSFLDVLENLQRFEDVQPGLIERFISVCWGIWKERNIIRTGGSSKPGRVTLKNSLGLMNEYQLANEGSRNPAAEPPEQIRWKPPSQGQYKVNTDGAVFANQRKVGLGVLIRDCSGALHDVGIRDAVFESDALEVVNAVQGITLPSSSTQFLVYGIHQQACLFRSCCFTHTKRQGNVPAHILAQYSKSLVSYVAWLESCPSHIMQACAQDLDVTSTV